MILHIARAEQHVHSRVISLLYKLPQKACTYGRLRPEKACLNVYDANKQTVVATRTHGPQAAGHAALVRQYLRYVQQLGAMHVRRCVGKIGKYFH